MNTMKNLICGRRLKKSKSVEGRRSHMNGSTYIPSSRTFDQTMAGTSREDQHKRRSVMATLGLQTST
ncbi:hypothetical protein AB6A40_005223 [Gnathostoma spinigerum]|uniref:Uncharacterized protein n=1 Tax=Gnathostoma spinigerum TaxID=75299 RepID=A0ABD6EMG7_9BILA